MKFTNYYSFVHNYSKLTSTLTHILKSSCAKLLAAKYTLKSQAKVYKKFGSLLKSPSGISFIKSKNKIKSNNKKSIFF